MRKNSKISFGGISLLVLLLVFSAFSTGCEKKEEEICAIFLCLLYGGGQQAQLTSDPIANPAESDVTIEWDTLSHTFPFVDSWDGEVYFQDTLDLDTLENYTVALSSDVGNCQGTVTLPGRTTITDPELGDTLNLGENVLVIWSAAQGADYYYLFYDLDAFDSTGIYISEWDYDTNLYVTSTSYDIPSTVFNAPVGDYYGVWFYIISYAGATPIPGESSNMSGGVKGFLSAEGFGSSTVFWVGEPVKKATKATIKSKLPSIEDRINTYRKAFGLD